MAERGPARPGGERGGFLWKFSRVALLANCKAELLVIVPGDGRQLPIPEKALPGVPGRKPANAPHFPTAGRGINNWRLRRAARRASSPRCPGSSAPTGRRCRRACATPTARRGRGARCPSSTTSCTRARRSTTASSTPSGPTSSTGRSGGTTRCARTSASAAVRARRGGGCSRARFSPRPRPPRSGRG